jgi:drug/metabolite transporter (DMT)-like permease
MVKHTKAYIALVYICIVWGTTYLAIRIGVQHYPSFLFAGVRQAVAGLILIPVALFMNKQRDMSVKNILQQMLVGFLMLTVGNGLVSFGLRFIPSGVSALICSMMPIFAVLFNLLSSKRDHFNATIGLGLLLGVCGVGLIFRHNIEDIAKPAYLGGIWALGTVINKRNTKQTNPFFNSGMQLLFGGIFMLMISPVVDNYNGFQLWNTAGILSLVYLIIFGSALAYAAYMYSLSVLPVGIATIYAYVNPLIAVMAGYLFLKETFNIYIGMAFITIAISVYLMNKGYRKQHKAALAFNQSQIEEAFPESIPIE